MVCYELMGEEHAFLGFTGTLCPPSGSMDTPWIIPSSLRSQVIDFPVFNPTPDSSTDSIQDVGELNSSDDKWITGVCGLEISAQPFYLPPYLIEDEFTSADFAKAINHFVDMGEEETITTINTFFSKLTRPLGDNITNRHEAAVRLLRSSVLFEPKPREPERQHRIVCTLAMPRDWPVVQSGLTYFVLYTIVQLIRISRIITRSMHQARH